MTRSRQLAAIMFTDIEGYTALMQQNEEKEIQARDRHRQIFNSITEMYKGRVLHCTFQDKFMIPCPKFGTTYYEIIM